MRLDSALGQFMAFYVNKHLPKHEEAKQPWDLMPFLQEPEWSMDQLMKMWD